MQVWAAPAVGIFACGCIIDAEMFKLEVSMNARFFVLASVPVMIMYGCGEPHAATETDSDPVNSIPHHDLIIADSIGVELGDSNYVFGSIEAVSHAENGNILVLDRAACTVLEFTPEGDFIRRMGRRGSGPGEFLNPLAMTRLGDGRIAVLDSNLGGMFTFFPDGTYEGLALEMMGEPVLFLSPSAGNTFIGTRNSWARENDEFICTAVVACYGLGDEEPLQIFWQNSFPWDFQDITPLIKNSYFARTWASDRDGNVFVAPRSSDVYSISGFYPNGEESVTIEMEMDPVAKTRSEIEEEAYFWNRRAENMGAQGPFTYQPDENRWMIHSMGIDGEKRLWVRRGTETVPTFDVFDLQGDLLFTASIPDVSGERGLFWEVKFDEFGILAYSLDPSEGYQKLYLLEMD